MLESYRYKKNKIQPISSLLDPLLFLQEVNIMPTEIQSSICSVYMYEHVPDRCRQILSHLIWHGPLYVILAQAFPLGNLPVVRERILSSFFAKFSFAKTSCRLSQTKNVEHCYFLIFWFFLTSLWNFMPFYFVLFFPLKPTLSQVCKKILWTVFAKTDFSEHQR